MLNEIWVLAEYKNSQIKSITAEILTEGRRLATKIEAKLVVCIFGSKVDDYIDQLRDYGVEKIYIVENEMLSEYSLDMYTFIFKKLIDKYNPLLVAMGATPIGNELAPRIAARLKLPCITEIKKIDIDNKNIVIFKSGFCEKVYFNFNFISNAPIVITFMPGDIDSEVVKTSKQIEILKEEIKISSKTKRVRNAKFIKGDPKEIRLDEAELIVAGGMGVNAEGLSVLEELADILCASVGGTRPLADNNVIPFERQIGITGKSVSPKLLIACGISGAREFTMGIDKETLVVAINKDVKAPIFNAAVLGVHGDINDIIPELIKAINERRKLE